MTPVTPEAWIQGWVIPPGCPEPSVTRLLGGEATGPMLRWAALTPGEVSALAAELRLGREEVLLRRPARALAAVLGRAGERFLDRGDPLRHLALEWLPPTSGLSPAMARVVLEGMAADWTPSRLEGLLEREFPRPEVLDRPLPLQQGGKVMAVSPPLTLQVVSGSVPGVSATALLRSLLVKAAVVVKPGFGDVALPLLLARAIREEDPELARCLAVIYWPGGEAASLEEALLSEAEGVVVYGGPEATGAWRRRIPPGIPIHLYPHRFSFGVVGREDLRPGRDREVAGEAARAVALFDGRGCVSPQIIFVEEGGGCAPGEWAGLLAEELAELEEELPRGHLTPEELSTIQQLRGVMELREAAEEGCRVLKGKGGRWTVLVDPGPQLAGSCPGRVVRVRPVGSVEELPTLLARLRPILQTAALAGEGERLERLARSLARVGVSRVTDFPRMPWPPPWWHHDGEGPLRVLVRWVDLDAPPSLNRPSAAPNAT